VAVNPYLFTTDRKAALVPVLKYVVATVPGIGSDIAGGDLKELAYDRVPLKTFHSLRKFQATVRAELPKVTQPVLVYASRQDHVVEPANATFVAERVGSSDVQLVWLESSYHVATLDLDRQLIFD